MSIIPSVKSVSYYRNLIRSLIKEPLLSSYDFRPKNEIEFFQKKLFSNNRVQTGLNQSESTYLGSWYYQGSFPTCGPWSLGNALFSQGVRPDENLISDLFNIAIDKKNPGGKGISLLKMKEISDKEYAHTKISLLPLSKDFRSRSDSITVPPILDYEALIKKNAKTLKSTIDAGSKIVASLYPKNYSEIESNEAMVHAVCIAGYKVSKEGFMDIQLIDSARGIFHTSLEHLTNSIYASGYKVSIK